MRFFMEEIVVPFFMMLCCIGLILLLIVGAICPFAWISAKNEAMLYNQKFNTQYTTSQFFWAGETIKSFLKEGKQTTQNVNINGAIPVRIDK